MIAAHIERTAPELACLRVEVLQPQTVAVDLGDLAHQLPVGAAVVGVIDHHAMTQESRVVVGCVAALVVEKFCSIQFALNFLGLRSPHGERVQTIGHKYKKVAHNASLFIGKIGVHLSYHGQQGLLSAVFA